MRIDRVVMLMLVSLLVTACSAPVPMPATAPTESVGDADVSEATPAPTEADEEMTEADAGMTDLDVLVTHPWQWVSFSSPEETFDVEMPASYLVLFNTDGIVDITADCNTAIASYGVAGSDAGSLSMEVAPKTKAACPPDSRSEQFLTLLATAADYAYVDDQLHIGLASDGGTMVFAPAEAD